MAVHRRLERRGEPRARGGAERCRLGKELWGLLPKRGDGLAKLQELVCRLAHPFHEDVTCPRQWRPKHRMTFFSSWWRLWASFVSFVARLRHRGVMRAISSSGFCAPYTGWWHR